MNKNSNITSHQDNNYPATQDFGNFPITFGVIIGAFSALAILLLIIYLCTRKPTRNSSGTAHSRGDSSADSVTIEIGLDEATLNAYPTLVYNEAKVAGGGDRNSCCSICLVDYCDTDILRALPNCDHLYHTQCIDPWLKKHTTCPICRNSPAQTPSTAPNESAVTRSVDRRGRSYDTWLVQLMR